MAFLCHFFQNEHPSSAGIKILDMEKDFSHMNCNSEFYEWLIGPFLVVLLHLASQNLPGMAVWCYFCQNSNWKMPKFTINGLLICAIVFQHEHT